MLAFSKIAYSFAHLACWEQKLAALTQKYGKSFILKIGQIELMTLLSKKREAKKWISSVQKAKFIAYQIVLNCVESMNKQGPPGIKVSEHGCHSTKKHSEENSNSKKHSKYAKTFLTYICSGYITISDKKNPIRILNAHSHMAS